jgi:hypothetical protein
MCGHQHGRHAWRRFGRVPSADDLLKLLEERQRDLEQEVADVADLIRRLREQGTTQTATV